MSSHRPSYYTTKQWSKQGYALPVFVLYHQQFYNGKAIGTPQWQVAEANQKWSVDRWLTIKIHGKV